MLIIEEIIKKESSFAEAAKNKEEMRGHHKEAKIQEVSKLKKRLISALIFSLPIIYMVMGEMLGLPMPMFFENYGTVIQLILAAAVIISCFNIWRSGFKKLLTSLRNLSITS